MSKEGTLEKNFRQAQIYHEGTLSVLDKRIIKETGYREYKVYSTLMDEEEVKGSHYFPIVPEEGCLSKAEALKAFKEKKVFKYKTIFIKREYEEIEKIINENRGFQGNIIDQDNKHYRFLFKLEWHKEYVEKEKELYKVFKQNEVNWKTLYLPYSRKFFDICILYYVDDMSNLKEIKEIQWHIQWLENDIIFNKNIIPVWSIEYKKEMKVGIRDKIVIKGEKDFYCYKVEKGPIPMMIASDQIEIIYVGETQKHLYVYTQEEKIPTYWKVYIFNKKGVLENTYPIVGNEQRKITNEETKLLSQLEVHKIIREFSHLSEITPVKVELAKNIRQEQGMCTYDCNHFMIKNDDEKRTLGQVKVSFSVKTKTIYTVDEISFVLSELSLKYPYYNWIAELI